MMTQQKNSTLKQRRALKNAKIRKDACDKSGLPSSLPSACNSRTTSNSSQPPKKTRRRKPSAIVYSQPLEYIRRCKEQARGFCQDTPVQATNGKVQLAIDECIPGELMVLIFTFLDPAMLFETLMFVSKRWLSLAKNNTLWKPIVQAKYGKNAGRYTEENKMWFEICHRLHKWHWDSRVHRCVKQSLKNTVASINVPRGKWRRMVLRVYGQIESGVHHFSLCLIKSKKANIGFGLANKNINCSTVTQGFNVHNNGIGYYSVGGMYTGSDEAGGGESPTIAAEIPKYGEGELVSMLLDMDEGTVTFFKWANKAMESFSFRSAKIRINRYQKEAMHVVCLVKGNAKVAIECCPLPPTQAGS